MHLHSLVDWDSFQYVHQESPANWQLCKQTLLQHCAGSEGQANALEVVRNTDARLAESAAGNGDNSKPIGQTGSTRYLSNRLEAALLHLAACES